MTKPTNPAVSEGDDLPEQMRVRREKRQRLLDEGVEPYPVVVGRTTTLAAVRERFPDLPPDTDTGDIVGIAGRVIFLRNSGKLCFATLREGGERHRTAGDGVAWPASVPNRWPLSRPTVDLGDHLFVHGEVITSRRGELSVLADSLVDRGQGAPAAAGRAQATVRREPGPATLRRSDRPAAGARDGADAGGGQSLAAGRRCTSVAISRSKRRCCRSCTAARRRVRSSPI